MIHYQDDMITLHQGAAAAVAADIIPGSVRTIVTSPPYYGLRDYGHEDQIGAEESPAEYVAALVQTFRALRPALADDGTLWLNLGDSYAATRKGTGGTGKSTLGAASGGHGISEAGIERSQKRQSTDVRRFSMDVPAKNLLGIPWRVAFALQDDGWILRSDIIWAKPNPMPESVTDRPTKAHEYLFLFAKSPRYYYDDAAIAEPISAESAARYAYSFGGPKIEALHQTDFGRTQPVGMRETPTTRSKRTVWTVNTVAFPGAHFATYPPELIRPCILAGSARGDVVLDPFSGSGTTGHVATQEGRRYVGIDTNPDYLDMSLRTRFLQPTLDLTGEEAS